MDEYEQYEERQNQIREKEREIQKKTIEFMKTQKSKTHKVKFMRKIYHTDILVDKQLEKTWK